MMDRFMVGMSLPMLLLLGFSIMGVTYCQPMAFWLTDPDRNILFQEQSTLMPISQPNTSNKNIIHVNVTEQYQSIDGFGFALTGGSAMLLAKLNITTRTAILRELFDIDYNNIGVTYLRVSIGSSDLNEAVFSYDDLQPGETDPNMLRFNLGIDRQYLVPILKEILTINPTIKILGSPWSPPVWMKNNGQTIGGSLLPQYFDVYALYFVCYIQSMQEENIVIDAITVQNEALYGGNNPSMVMHSEQQALFIKKHLGPAFRKYSIKTKILIYDHNPDRPDYPLSVLHDHDARQYIDGTAFHMYAGRIETLSVIHDLHPDKNIYFTEQWVAAPGHLKHDLVWHVKTLIVGATRSWARNVLEWNLASDPQWKPHTPGGCSNCLGALTIDGNNIWSPRNPSYYIVAHAAKFVRPNAVRVDSNMIIDLPNVAFQRQDDGKRVLIVVNESNNKTIQFQIQCDNKLYQTLLNGGSVGTYIW